eukprot:g11339.t1
MVFKRDRCFRLHQHRFRIEQLTKCQVSGPSITVPWEFDPVNLGSRVEADFRRQGAPAAAAGDFTVEATRDSSLIKSRWQKRDEHRWGAEEEQRRLAEEEKLAARAITRKVLDLPPDTDLGHFEKKREQKRERQRKFEAERYYDEERYNDGEGASGRVAGTEAFNACLPAKRSTVESNSENPRREGGLGVRVDSDEAEDTSIGTSSIAFVFVSLLRRPNDIVHAEIERKYGYSPIYTFLTGAHPTAVSQAAMKNIEIRRHRLISSLIEDVRERIVRRRHKEMSKDEKKMKRSARAAEAAAVEAPHEQESSGAPPAKKLKKSQTKAAEQKPSAQEGSSESDTESTSSTSHEQNAQSSEEDSQCPEAKAKAKTATTQEHHQLTPAAFRSEKSIRILSDPNGCPAPIQTFAGLRDTQYKDKVPSWMLDVFSNSGFTTPSPIQCQAWSVALVGKDMVGNAETGSGKTLAFLVPAVVHILQQEPLNTAPTSFARRDYGAWGTSSANNESSFESGPICLVLAPTRELAAQIEEGARKLGGPSRKSSTTGGKKLLGSQRGLQPGLTSAPHAASNPNDCLVRSTVLVGGTSKGPQIRDLTRGSEIVIATPGRLLDLLDLSAKPGSNFTFNLKRVSFLVLDEADRMLDMGFAPDLKRIGKELERRSGATDKVQTLMFSATWPKEVQRLASDLIGRDKVHIHVGEGTIGELKCNPRISQKIEMSNPKTGEHWTEEGKIARIKEILKEEKEKAVASGESAVKTVVFTMTKRGCDDVAWKLQSQGALAIHGDKTQMDRDWCLAEFKKENSGYDILVATDVAARGLDVKNVKCVINFDFPLNVEDYVHRIGRTGRAGTFGSSYSFFVATDLKNANRSAYELCNMLRKAEQEVPEELEILGGKGGGFGGGKGKGKGRFGGGGKGKGKFGGGGKGAGKRKW